MLLDWGIREREIKSECQIFILRIGRKLLSFIEVGKIEEKAGEKHQVFVLGHVQFEAPVMYSQG